MFNAWFYLMLIVTLADWLAVFRGLRRVRRVTKPLVLLLLILWFTSLGGWERVGLFFGLALICSLLGDIFLLDDLVDFKPVFFHAGLLAFLMAQISYILAFNRDGVPPGGGWLAFLLLVGVISIYNGSSVLSGLQRTREGARQKVPMVVYMVALSLMLVSAFSMLLRPGWAQHTALTAGMGGALFYVSDSVLANNTFVKPIPWATLIVSVTYHLGQILIVTGVMRHFL